jgi:hypothetical protein
VNDDTFFVRRISPIHQKDLLRPGLFLFFSALLAQLDVRNIDRHKKWFSIYAGVFPGSEYAVHSRKLDPGHLYIGIDIVCAGCASGDFDIVVVTLQEPLLGDRHNRLPPIIDGGTAYEFGGDDR